MEVNPNDRFEWLPLLPNDLESVHQIAERLHKTLPERPEVFEEKVAIYPEGCRKLANGSQTLGYGIAYPWLLNSIPPLDAFLKTLPASPECLFIHDVVVLPEARGNHVAARYVDYIKGIALESGIQSLSLVSVYGTDVLWGRYGFRVIANSELSAKLASYGESAQYMVCNLQ